MHGLELWIFSYIQKYFQNSAKNWLVTKKLPILLYFIVDRSPGVCVQLSEIICAKYIWRMRKIIEYEKISKSTNKNLIEAVACKAIIINILRWDKNFSSLHLNSIYLRWVVNVGGIVLECFEYGMKLINY